MRRVKDGWLRRVGAAAAVAALCAAPAAAGIVENGSFETGLLAPDFFEIGDARVVGPAFGVSPTSGQFQALVTTGVDRPSPPTTPTPTSAAAADFDGGSPTNVENALDLPAGTLDAAAGGFDAFEGSGFGQTVTLGVGDSVSFDANFLSLDQFASAFNDFGFVSLVDPTGTLTQLTRLGDTFTALLPATGGYRFQTGYNTFTTGPVALAGEYTLGFGVVDVGDGFVSSGLLVDNVQTVTAAPADVPEPSSIALLSLVGGGAVVGRWVRRRRTAGATA